MPGQLQPTDADLVADALKGDGAAFDALIGRHQRRATAVAYRLLGDVDDAMEVTQEAFLRAYDKLASLAAPDRFGAWLLRTVSNQALNRRRRRAIRRTSSLDRMADADDGRADSALADAGAETPEQAASAGELKAAIRMALEELPDKQRMALELFSIQKMPQKEVAAALGMSVEAVKWNVFAARKTLKERFRDYL